MILDALQVGLFGSINKINLTHTNVLIIIGDYNNQNYPCDERHCAIGKDLKFTDTDTGVARNRN
jgi:hypothetical protein